MLADNLLDKIQFTEEMKNEYYKYKNMIGDKLEAIAKSYVENKDDLKETLEKTHKLANEKLHIYTIDLLFILESSGYLYKEYQKQNISDEIFINTMRDVTFKVRECLRVKKMFGIFVIEWYDGFYKMTRYSFGRLQFDITKYKNDDITLCGYTLKKGDYAVNCHIPADGRLLREDCIKAYKAVYEFSKDRIKENILPITCDSWLLYPPYQDVFGRDSNIGVFASDFKITGTIEQDKFHDVWRVFATDKLDIEALPTKTRLQRAFIEYIKSNGTYGEGVGVILFDGERVLTRE